MCTHWHPELSPGLTHSPLLLALSHPAPIPLTVGRGLFPDTDDDETSVMSKSIRLNRNFKNVRYVATRGYSVMQTPEADGVLFLQLLFQHQDCIGLSLTHQTLAGSPRRPMTAGIVVTLSQSSNRLPLHDDLTFLENVATLQLPLLSHSFSVPTPASQTPLPLSFLLNRNRPVFFGWI